MVQKATLVVLFLVFAAAIFIHYLLTNVEAFKNKKKKRAGKKGGSKKKRGSKKRKGKKRAGKKGSKKKSSKKRSGKKGSKKRAGKKGSKKRGSKKRSGKKGSKKRSSKKRSSKKRSGKKGKKGSKKRKGKKSSKKRSGKKRSSKSRKGKKRSSKKRSSKSRRGSHSGMKFSEVVGSLLTPSLPDARDMKDRMFAPADLTSACQSLAGNCAVRNRNLSLNQCTNNIKGCKSNNPTNDNCTSASNVASNAMPYITNMNEYIKKDSIPCYGCNL